MDHHLLTGREESQSHSSQLLAIRALCRSVSVAGRGWMGDVYRAGGSSERCPRRLMAGVPFANLAARHCEPRREAP